MEYFAKDFVSDPSYDYVGAIWSWRNGDKYEEFHSLYQEVSRLFVVVATSEQSGPDVWATHKIYELDEYLKEFPERKSEIDKLLADRL